MLCPPRGQSVRPSMAMCRARSRASQAASSALGHGAPPANGSRARSRQQVQTAPLGLMCSTPRTSPQFRPVPVLLWTGRVWRIMSEAGRSSQGTAVDVIIIGGGIGGLTLALALHGAGIACRVYEAAPEIKPIGVGINLLPHAMLELAGLGLEATLAARGVVASESVFFNRFGQLIYREALGRAAGYAWPQISIHRGDLQAVLIEACRERLGSDRLMLGWLCTGTAQDERAAVARFEQTGTGQALPPQRGSV